MQDVRTHSRGLLRRAIAMLPGQVREHLGDAARPVVRADTGYCATELALTAVGLGMRLRYRRQRTPAVWPATATDGKTDWHRRQG